MRAVSAFRIALLVAVVAAGTAGQARAQGLYFSTQREVSPPDYATFRMGPFYSTMALTESVGIRYTTSSGTGTDYLIENDRGEIDEDGVDFPILSALTFRNYLIISRNMDLDLSVRLGYYYYPLDTQEDETIFDMTEEGVYGTISTAVRLSEYLTGTIYDNIYYRTDYVDTRGVADTYGGSDYEHFANRIGGQLNWRMAPDHSSAFALSRHDVIPADDEYDEQERYAYSESVTYTYQAHDNLAVGLRASSAQSYYRSDDRDDTRQDSYDVFVTYGRGGQEAAGIRVTERSTLRLSLGTAVGYTASKGSSSDTGDGDDDVDEASAEEWDDGSLRVVGSAELETLLTKTVTQKIGYQRGLRDGFNSAFEEYDGVRYGLRWNGRRTTVDASSRLNNVDPSLNDDTDYSDWINALSVAWRMTEAVTLEASTIYSIRDNDPSEDVDLEDTDVEDLEDYETWSSRIGTSFQIAREVTFSTYFQHVERFSDDEDLAYDRDTFQAMLTYQHQF